MENALGGLAGATVGGSVDLEGIGGTKHGAELAARFGSLSVSFGRELDAVVRYGLVDVAILIAFALGMADEDYKLFRLAGIGMDVGERNTLGLPMMTRLRRSVRWKANCRR